MINQVVIAGRIVEIKRKDLIITIAVPRYWKNEKGEYDTDIINVSMDELIMKNISEYCKKDNIVGIKGRLETIENELILKCGKFTFLSSKTEEQKESE